MLRLKVLGRLIRSQALLDPGLQYTRPGPFFAVTDWPRLKKIVSIGVDWINLMVMISCFSFPRALIRWVSISSL